MKQMIICGDCIEEIAKLPDKSVDIVITSPVYNIDKNYNLYDDKKPYESYLAWLDLIFVDIKRILKDNGSFFLNVASTCKEPWKTTDIGKTASKSFVLQNNITWVKSITVNENSYGHFKPTVSKRFLNQLYETIFHFTKDGTLLVDRLGIGVPYQCPSNVDRWKHSNKEEKIDKRCRGNVWFIPYKTVHSEKTHPAAFPIELPKQCIRMHGLRSDLIVLDPFMGSGSTLLACKELQIQGIGIDIDEYYCDMTKSRLNE